MSYEGYERWLCMNGHLHAFDCYMTPDSKTWACPVDGCGETCEWIECVDQTNDGGHPRKLKIFKPAVYETCGTCGHQKMLEPERYKLPMGSKGQGL